MAEAQAATAATIVVLPFENVAGKPEEVHWSHAAGERLVELLRAVAQVQIVPGARYGLRELGLQAGAEITDAQARRIGELSEAAWVAWGSWAREGDEWRFTIRVLATVGDAPAAQAAIVQADWFAGLEEAGLEILSMMDVDPAEKEVEEMKLRPTESAEAYALVSQARMWLHANESFQRGEEAIRKARALDPKFGRARNALLSVLWGQGEQEEAERLLEALIGDEPEVAQYRCSKGYLAMYKGDLDGAEVAFREAIARDPSNADAHEGLGRTYVERGRWLEALDVLTKAKALNPFGSNVHALLGKVYLETDQPEAAREALLESERFLDGDVDAEIQLGHIYAELAEFPAAASHLARALELCKALDADPEVLAMILRMWQAVQERLTPQAVEAERPREYTEVELQGELARRLTPEELEVVVNPFAINEEMKAWGREQVKGAESDQERARALFEVLVGRVKGRGKGGARTAREVFEVWDDPEESLSCQEYAKLFVSLGRELGLETFYVHLERDYQGRVVYHDCAALFLEDKAYLVDPAYRWFGVPHREHEILDDIEAIAHHSFQGGDGEVAVARRRLALKLHPDHGWGQVRAASAYFNAGDIPAALRHLEEAETLEPGRWDAFVLKGKIALQQGNAEQAREHFTRAREVNPESSQVQFFMGTVLKGLQEYQAAVESFRAALRYDDGYSDEVIEATRRSLAEANHLLVLSGGDPSAAEAIEARAEAGDVDAQVVLARHYMEGEPPDPEKAFVWLQKAAEQGHLAAQFQVGLSHYLGRGTARDRDEGLKWLQRASDEGLGDASYALATHYWSINTMKGALEMWRKSLRLAAEQGHVEGQYVLGMSYYQGDGLERNILEAHRWLSRAHGAGHERAGQFVREIEEFDGDELEAARKAAGVEAP